MLHAVEPCRPRVGVASSLKACSIGASFIGSESVGLSTWLSKILQSCKGKDATRRMTCLREESSIHYVPVTVGLIRMIHPATQSTMAAPDLTTRTAKDWARRDSCARF